MGCKSRDEKLQYDISRDVTKILTLLSGKVDKYEHLTGEEKLSSNQRQITQKAKFANSPFRKAFKNQLEKQVGAIKSLKPSNKKMNLKKFNVYIHKIRWKVQFELN